MVWGPQSPRYLWVAWGQRWSFPSAHGIHSRWAFCLAVNILTFHSENTAALCLASPSFLSFCLQRLHNLTEDSHVISSYFRRRVWTLEAYRPGIKSKFYYWLSKSTFLKPQHTPISGELVGTDSNMAGLEWSPELWVSNQLLGDTDALARGHTLKVSGLWLTLLKYIQLSEPTPSIGEKQKVMLVKIALTPGNRKQTEETIHGFIFLT